MNSQNNQLLAPVRGLVGHVQRYSTLVPIFGRNKQARSLQERVLLLQRIWQKRVHELEGWGVVDVDKSLSCKVSFCYTKQSGRFCLHYNFCPFCYSRRVAKIFETILTVCRDDEHQVLFRSAIRPTGATENQDLAAGLELSNQRYSRRNRMRKLNPAGALVWQGFVPNEGTIDYHAHGLYLYKPTQTIPEFLTTKLDPSDTIEICSSRDRTVVAKLVSRCFAYPNQLLFGNPGLVIAILQVISRRRMLSTYGNLRGVS